MNLNELFSTFHDFDIVGLERKNENLSMTLRVPWGELWDEFDFKIKVELIGGQIIEFKYFEYDDNSSIQSKSENKITNDLKTIEKLGIDIQRFETTTDNEYIFHCNGYSEIGGGQLRIKANDFKLFDNQEILIPSDKYKSWHKDWWAKIRNE